MYWSEAKIGFSIVFLSLYKRFIVNSFALPNATTYFSFIGWAHSCLWTQDLFNYDTIGRFIVCFMSICDNPFPSLTSCFSWTNFPALISHKFLCVTHLSIVCTFLYPLFTTITLHFADPSTIVFACNIAPVSVMSFWWTQPLLRTNPVGSWANSATAQSPFVFLQLSTWTFSTACVRTRHHSHSQWTCSLNCLQA